MDVDRFEQLVSRWLDEPQREDLLEEIETCCAQAPDLRTVYEAWVRLDALIRAAGRDVDAAVDWARLRARVLACCAAELPDDDFERFLRASTGLDAAVDWARLRDRIAASVRRDSTRAARGWNRPGLRTAVALLATAATLLLVSPRIVAWRKRAPAGGTHTSLLHAGTAANVFGRGVVRLRIGPPPGGRRWVAASQAALASGRQAEGSEFYMMIDSPRPVVEAGHRLSPFGFQ